MLREQNPSGVSALNARLRVAKVRFAQSEFKILRVLYNLSERMKEEPL